jgi:GH25 family lysozyme M1 (1,4-beta-N-acetylmuramidase)
VTIPSGTSTGTKYIWVILDVDSEANQSNENNDKGYTSFNVTSAPGEGEGEGEGEEETVYGVDVSHHQGVINWTSVASAGKRFAYVKATQATSNVEVKLITPEKSIDSKFVQNMTNGQAAGLVMGAYHFAMPYYTPDATEEADHFVSVAGPYIGDGFLPPALDMEWDENEPAYTDPANMSPTALSAWINTWMDRVESLTGVRPVLYSSQCLFIDSGLYLSTLNIYPIWVANWNGNPGVLSTCGLGPWNTWKFHQYTSTGSCSGIIGNTDLNVFNGTPADLQAFISTGGEGEGEGEVCDYGVSPLSKTFGASGGNASLVITAPNGCTWTTSDNASWVTITSGSSGSGNGSVNYTVSAYTGSAQRTATITVQGQTHTITQNGIDCNYTLSLAIKSFNASGGTGAFNVMTQDGCTWSASDNVGWITITAGSSGSGSGSVYYTVLPYNEIGERTAIISVQGWTHEIVQSGITCNSSTIIRPLSSAYPHTISGVFGGDCLTCDIAR